MIIKISCLPNSDNVSGRRSVEISLPRSYPKGV
jgi:hypothetical protein